MKEEDQDRESDDENSSQDLNHKLRIDEWIKMSWKKFKDRQTFNEKVNQMINNDP